MGPRPAIYLVPMPIGTRWSAVSAAVRDVLATADLVYMEHAPDRLAQMRAHGIVAPEREVRFIDGDLIGPVGDAIAAGRSVALVAATGMPCFVDPGWELVDHWLDHWVDRADLLPIAMSSALDAALAMSGHDVRTFTFRGHYPENWARTWRLLPHRDPILFYVRGGSVRAFVAEMRRSVRWIRRIALFADVGKEGRARTWVVRGNRGPLPDGLDDDPTRDVVAVVSTWSVPQLLGIDR